MKNLRHRVQQLTHAWEEPILTKTDMFRLVDEIVNAVRRNVTDQQKLDAIAADLAEVAARYDRMLR